MDHGGELLTFVNHNARMGMETTAHLMDILKDGPLYDELMEQHKAYRTLAAKAEAQAEEPLGKVPLPARAMSYLMIDMKTLMDRSPGNIAQMMVKGSANGIVEITKQLRQYEGTAPRAESLAKELLKMEEHHMEVLKGYIS
ncbi:MAG: hypothetical protein E7328_02135 [Clostridiales bacterium]|nr:hypothetical protein [Clostridiales bacterium]